jgi:hypothetical protein
MTGSRCARPRSGSRSRRRPRSGTGWTGRPGWPTGPPGRIPARPARRAARAADRGPAGVEAAGPGLDRVPAGPSGLHGARCTRSWPGTAARGWRLRAEHRAVRPGGQAVWQSAAYSTRPIRRKIAPRDAQRQEIELNQVHVRSPCGSPADSPGPARTPCPCLGVKGQRVQIPPSRPFFERLHPEMGMKNGHSRSRLALHGRLPPQLLALHRRLCEACGCSSPASLEAAYYRQNAALTEAGQTST